MPQTPAFPENLPRAFTVAQARCAGVPPGRLRGAAFTTPFHGVRVRGAVESGSLEASCHAAQPRLHAGQFFSHETALFGYGVPMPEWPYQPAVHVSTHRPAREPRTRGVIGHRLQTREPATALVNGLLLEDPVRAWRQIGTLWPYDAVVAAADFLISGSVPLASLGELRDEILVMGDVRRGILTRALRDARTGVRSARETRLRLLLQRAGLPEPEVGWNLFDDRGTFVAELDLAYPRYRVGVEYDGRVHADDPAQFARDADRWAAIRRIGWDHERVLSHHLDHGGAVAVAIARDALIRAGWTPGR